MIAAPFAIAAPADPQPGPPAATSDDRESEEAGRAAWTTSASDTIPGHRFFPLPFVFYQPETRFGGGFGVLHTYRTAHLTRPSSTALLAVYTERKQFSIVLEPEIYTARNLWRLNASFLWSRFPNTFFGIGNETRLDDDEDYTAEQTAVSADVRRAVLPGLYAGVIAAVQEAGIRDIEPDGALASSDVPGRTGGTLASAGVLAVLDDRDNVFQPQRGHLASLSFRRYDDRLGSDFESDRGELDARLYTPLGPGRTLATQILLGISGGERPFYDLAALGGPNTLRGIYEGRYRDRNRAVVQAELRFPLLGRLGGTVFAGAGEVARHARDLRVVDVHAAAGAGIRYLIMPREGARLRIDAGWADDGMQIYFGFGEAF